MRDYGDRHGMKEIIVVRGEINVLENIHLMLLYHGSPEWRTGLMGLICVVCIEPSSVSYGCVSSKDIITMSASEQLLLLLSKVRTSTNFVYACT